MHTIVYMIYWCGFIVNMLSALIWLSLMRKYNNYNFVENILPWILAVFLMLIDVFILTPFC